MPTSTRFSVAVHILTMLAVKSGVCVSSEQIAKSVATNPVVVRRMLAILAASGLVTTHAGTQGGAKLAVCPKELTLLKIYEAVEERSLFKIHHPEDQCALACSIKASVEKLMQGIETRMKGELNSVTLAQLIDTQSGKACE